MAHHKSALKRIRQSRRRRLYNRAKKRMIKDAIRSVKSASNYNDGLENLKKAMSILDKVTTKGVIHKNNAANKKSLLSKLVYKLKAQETS